MRSTRRVASTDSSGASGIRRPEIDLVDGRTYAARDLHDDLRWMRRHEPMYDEAANDLWANRAFAPRRVAAYEDRVREIRTPDGERGVAV